MWSIGGWCSDARWRSSFRLQAPAGGFSSTDPWQISRSHGTKEMKHNHSLLRIVSAAGASGLPLALATADFREHHIATELRHRHCMRSHHEGFTTAHPLRRFVHVFARWAAIARIKLEVHYLPGIGNEWADVLSRNKDSIRGFFNDLFSPGHLSRRVPEHEG